MKLLIGTLLLIIGTGGLVYTNRRKFYRRNTSGVEEFRSYGNMLLTRAYEKTMRILSALFIAAGAIVLLTLLSR